MNDRQPIIYLTKPSMEYKLLKLFRKHFRTSVITYSGVNNPLFSNGDRKL